MASLCCRARRPRSRHTGAAAAARPGWPSACNSPATRHRLRSGAALPSNAHLVRTRQAVRSAATPATDGSASHCSGSNTCRPALGCLRAAQRCWRPPFNIRAVGLQVRQAGGGVGVGLRRPDRRRCGQSGKSPRWPGASEGDTTPRPPESSRNASLWRVMALLAEPLEMGARASWQGQSGVSRSIGVGLTAFE